MGYCFIESKKQARAKKRGVLHAIYLVLENDNTPLYYPNFIVVVPSRECGFAALMSCSFADTDEVK
jgi:hypothetical protein